MPFATSSPRRDAAEDVDEDALHALVEVDDLERTRHHVGIGAAADVEEVGGRAADLIDDVEGRHGEPGAVGDDADRPLETDVLEALLGRHLLAVVHLGQAAEGVPFRMTELGALVEGHLGVERVHLARRLEDQRVDLGQVAVALVVAAVQLDDDVGGALDRALGELGVDTGLAGDVGGQPVDRVDVHLHDRVRVRLRDRLDLDATLGGQHHQMLLRTAVERERDVVLLVDVGGALDPDPAHEMALDVHPENVAGVLAHLVGVGGELDATGLPAAADLHLGLDDDGVAGGVGSGDRLVDRVGRATGADRDVVAGEVLLPLVFEQIHVDAFLQVTIGRYVRRAPIPARH